MKDASRPLPRSNIRAKRLKSSSLTTAAPSPWSGRRDVGPANWRFACSDRTTRVRPAPAIVVGRTLQFTAYGRYSDGSVVKHSVIAPHDVTHEEVAEASKQLNALLINTSLDSRVQVPSRNDHVATLVREAASMLHAEKPTTDGEQVFIGGSSRVAEAFSGVETVRKVLSILEQELLVVSLVQDILDQGLSVAIGSCAVIVAQVTVDGSPAGAVGLLGPTRMKYREALAAAQVVSEQLAKRFGGDEHG